jgi:hypothetical protein
MKTRWAVVFIPVLILVLALAGCYYTPSAANGSARASLMLAKQLPANVASIVLVVSGPGLKTVANEYAVGTDSVTLEVPAGVARTFTLLANTPSVTLKGEATVDLLPGETKEIVLAPLAFDSQIIVPDYRNYRLVQIADMAGTGWKAIQFSNLGLGMTNNTQFAPYDVDFDAQGRIYIANQYDGVVRLDDINDSLAEWLVRGASTAVGALAIAIDRQQNYLYYTNGSILNRVVIDPLGTPSPLNVTGVTNITGMAVGLDGILYLANYLYNSGGSLVKYDPGTAQVVASYSDLESTDPWDATVQGGFVYATYVNASSKKIVRLDLNLNFVDQHSGPSGDPLYGPRRFVAILGRRLHVIDEGYHGGDSNRLVAFRDMTGDGWTTYGSTGSGTDQFNFFDYYYC